MVEVIEPGQIRLIAPCKDCDIEYCVGKVDRCKGKWTPVNGKDLKHFKAQNNTIVSVHSTGDNNKYLRYRFVKNSTKEVIKRSKFVFNPG